MSFPSNRESQGVFTVPIGNIVTGPMTNTGTPMGNPSMVGDFSVTPGVFFTEVQPGTCLHLSGVNIYIRGPGVVGADKYGTLAQLANGLEITITDEMGAIIPNLGTLSIRTTGEFLAFGFTVEINGSGGGDSYVNARFVTTPFGTHFLMPPGYRVNVKAQDDFSTLTSHLAVVAGYTLESIVP